MDYNFKNPLEMTEFERKEVFSKIVMLGGYPALESYCEQWDAEHLLDKTKISSLVNFTNKSRWKGTRTEFIKMYTTELKRLRKDNIIDHTLLGVLTELASFIQYEDNVLRDENGKPLNQKQLATLLGIAEITAKKYFKKLSKEGLLLKKPNPNKKSSNMYYLSPQLFYQGVLIDSDLKKGLIEYHNQKVEEHKNIKH